MKIDVTVASVMDGYVSALWGSLFRVERNMRYGNDQMVPQIYVAVVVVVVVVVVQQCSFQTVSLWDLFSIDLISAN